MRKKQKKLSIVLSAFAVVLVAGIVYAAINGSLVFSGTANLGSNTMLSIVNANVGSYETLGSLASPSDDSYGTIVVSDDGKKATITANLAEPGDAQNFTFSVQNTGSTEAVVTGIITNILPPALGNINVTGDYSALNSQTINVGSTTGPYNVRVSWPESAIAAADKSFTFTIEINYEKP